MRVATVVQLLGLIAVTAGAALIAPWLGLIVGGVLAVLAGIALERGE
jgi:ammonia channel protein AmtB